MLPFSLEEGPSLQPELPPRLSRNVGPQPRSHRHGSDLAGQRSPTFLTDALGACTL